SFLVATRPLLPVSCLFPYTSLFRSPLIHCIAHKHLECVSRLLERSARLDPGADTDHVPLNLACEHGSLPIAETLLKHGAKLLPEARKSTRLNSSHVNITYAVFRLKN